MNALDVMMGNYVSITCCTCGLTFGVPVAWHAERQARCDNFKCPNDHALCYGKGPTEAEKLQKKLAAAEEALQRSRSREVVAERRRRAAKGQVTKLKQRLESGR
jgi:hypothetical protein